MSRIEEETTSFYLCNLDDDRVDQLIREFHQVVAHFQIRSLASVSNEGKLGRVRMRDSLLPFSSDSIRIGCSVECRKDDERRYDFSVNIYGDLQIFMSTLNHVPALFPSGHLGRMLVSSLREAYLSLMQTEEARASAVAEDVHAAAFDEPEAQSRVRVTAGASLPANDLTAVS